MQSARMAGHVVLDAIIHTDGIIGDITVLQSTNDAFAQSAIAAVKQWHYAVPGFEGILTVNVNFTMNGSAPLSPAVARIFFDRASSHV